MLHHLMIMTIVGSQWHQPQMCFIQGVVSQNSIHELVFYSSFPIIVIQYPQNYLDVGYMTWII